MGCRPKLWPDLGDKIGMAHLNCQHVGTSWTALARAECQEVLSDLEISVAAGTGADVMAGGAGAAGPTPDVHNQPQGYPDLLPYNTGYPGLSRDIQTYPKTRLSRDITC